MPGFANDSSNNSIMWSDNVDFSGNVIPSRAITTNGQLLIGSTAAPNIRANTLSSSDSSITITNGPGTIDLKSNPLVVPDLHTAKWIVNNVPNSGGNQTTISAAIAAASAGDTIFIMPGSTGVYTENFTLPANINLVGFTGDGDTPHVTIKGKVTMTAAGTSTISNIRLETNGDFCIVVSGSAASVLILLNAYINGTNNSPISYTSSNASSSIVFKFSSVVTVSGALFSSSSAGVLQFYYCNVSQSTSTANTVSAGVIQFFDCSVGITNITTSGTSDFFSFRSNFTAGNTTGPVLTHGGTGTMSYVDFCEFRNNNGAGPVISVSAGATLKCGHITATNFAGGVASIGGAGTIQYSIIDSLITTNTVTTTTQTKIPIDTGLVRSVNGITFDGGTNTLANYAVGTFTPTFVGASTAGTTTYTAQNGYYTRVGNIVVIQAQLIASSATGTGALVLGGFPFTVKNQTNYNMPGSFLISSSNTWPAGTTFLQPYAAVNTTTGSVYAQGTGSAGGLLQMANTAWTFGYTLVYQI